MAQSFSAQQMADIQRMVDQAHDATLANVQGIIDPTSARANDLLPIPPTPPGSPGAGGSTGGGGAPGMPGEPGEPGDPGEPAELGGLYEFIIELMNDIQELREHITNLVDQVNEITYSGYLVDVEYDVASRTFSKTLGRMQPNALGGVAMGTNKSPVFVAATDCD